jgi:hypothetical protein
MLMEDRVSDWYGFDVEDLPLTDSRRWLPPQ